MAHFRVPFFLFVGIVHVRHDFTFFLFIIWCIDGMLRVVELFDYYLCFLCKFSYRVSEGHGVPRKQKGEQQ